MLVGNQRLNPSLLDSEEDITVGNIIHNPYTLGTVFLVGVSPDRTSLYNNFMLRESGIQSGHLIRRKGNAVIHRYLGFFNQSNFHYATEVLCRSQKRNFLGMVVRK